MTLTFTRKWGKKKKKVYLLLARTNERLDDPGDRTGRVDLLTRLQLPDRTALSRIVVLPTEIASVSADGQASMKGKKAKENPYVPENLISPWGPLSYAMRSNLCSRGHARRPCAVSLEFCASPLIKLGVPHRRFLRGMSEIRHDLQPCLYTCRFVNSHSSRVAPNYLK